MLSKSPMISQMETICRNYIIARSIIKTISYPYNCGVNIHECTDIILKVDKAFYSLTQSEQRLINNEFFYEARPYWWKESYSEEEYVTFLKQTIQRFLEVYYEIN